MDVVNFRKQVSIWNFEDGEKMIHSIFRKVAA